MVFAIGGGGGGGGGYFFYGSSTTNNITTITQRIFGGAGGGSGGCAFRIFSINDFNPDANGNAQTAANITIGAGGGGGTAVFASSNSLFRFPYQYTTPGANGGDTTFTTPHTSTTIVGNGGQCAQSPLNNGQPVPNSGNYPGAGGSSSGGLFTISGNTGGTPCNDSAVFTSSGSLFVPSVLNMYSSSPGGASTFWGGGRGGNGANPTTVNASYNGSSGENGLVVILEF